MSALEVGKKLVDLCNAGKAMEAVQTLYSEKIVSIEGQGSEELPARMEGLQAVEGKSQWWFDNHEVHATSASGPFIGHRDDQFIVKFNMDVTPKQGDRMQLSEVGLYTIEDGKVVQEEFLYLVP